ncbi:MAG: carboxypeptidase regulatory-like domain-containing protein [Phycisphaerae bacterium]
MTLRRIMLFTLVAAVLGGAAALAWRVAPRTARYYTDGDTIRHPLGSLAPRDVLWQPPRALAELVDAAGDVYEPKLSWDGLSLFFVRGKAGANADLWVARRTPTGWSPPAPLGELNTQSDELGPAPSFDGAVLYFYSDRAGGVGGYDLWVAQREGERWLGPTNLGAAVNTEFNEYAPAPAPDGATLYFSSNRPRPDDERQPNPDAWPATVREDRFHRTYDLYAAALTDRGVGVAAPLVLLNTPFNEGPACVSPAGDFLYFSSDRPDGQGGFDLYRARRLRGAFQPPTNLGPPVNSVQNELDPGLTALGFALYFSSDAADAAGAADTAAREGPRRAPAYGIYYTTSREVFVETERDPRPPIDWAGLWARVGPSLLWALLSLLMLLLLLALGRDLWRRRLSLLARCLLASLMAHLLLMMLMSVWNVTAGVLDALRDPGLIEVALVPAAAADTLAAQLTDLSIEVATPTAEALPTLARPVVGLAAAPAELVTLEAAPSDAAREESLSAATDVAEARVPAETRVVASSAAPPTRTTPAELSLPAAPAPAAPRAEPALVAPAATPLAIEPVRDAASAASESATPSVIVTPAPSAADASVVDVPLTAQSPRIAESSPRASSAAATVLTPVDSTTAVVDLALPVSAAPVVHAAPAEPALPPVEHAPAERQPMEAPVAAAPAALTELPVAGAARSTTSGESDVEMVSGLPRASVDATDRRLETRFVRPAAPAVRFDTPSPVVALPAESAPTRAPPASESADSPASPAPATLAVRRAPPPRADLTRLAPPDTLVRELGPPTTVERSSDASLIASTKPPGDASLPNARGVRVREPASPAPRPDVLSVLRLPTETTPPKPTFAQRAPERREEVVQRMGGSPETEAAVRRALVWLAEHQSADGRWDGGAFDAGCGGCGGATHYDVNVALTGLATLCFLGAGHTPTSDGPYQAHVDRALRWLVARQAPDGDLRAGETMYSHGIAAIALSEALGMTSDAALAGPVHRAAGFIARAQNRHTGGWRYDPGDDGDTSVLGWQLMALKSAQLAGVPVSHDLLSGAQRWLDRVELRSRPGLFSYRPGEPVSVAMTAEAMFVRQLLGAPRDDERMRGGLAYLAKSSPRWRADPNTYGWYYTTLALFHHQGREWERWNAELVPELLRMQATDGAAAGSWPPDGEWAAVGGRVYQTAICTLMLEVYYRYLPLYAAPSATTRPSARFIVGTVTDAGTGQPIGGARVRVDREGPELVATADAHGRYALPAPPDAPEHFALSAQGAGYVPASVNVRAAAADAGLVQDFALAPQTKATVVIEAAPDVHHLGNDRFQGRVNSQFQKASEGRRFRAPFELDDQHLARLANAATPPRLRLLTRGVQCPHELRLNGVRLPTPLGESPEDGSFGEFAVELPAALLRAGENEISITAVSCRGDLDDFEFVNLRIEIGATD